jgi:hypothetical protein
MIGNDSERDEGRLERRGHEISVHGTEIKKSYKETKPQCLHFLEHPSSDILPRTDALASPQQTGLAITKQPRLSTEHSGLLHALKSAHSATRIYLPPLPPLRPLPFANAVYLTYKP